MKVIASHNGLKATQAAYDRLRDGASPIDAVVHGVTKIEDDPNEMTVGYGGLPNEDGVVELDAAVMDGATHRAGAVAGLQNIRHATAVAQMVMDRTRRVLLVGEGAKRFAIANGFPQEDLLTEKSRQMWLYWKRTRSKYDDWLAPHGTSSASDIERWFEKHFYGPESREGSSLEGREGSIQAEKTGTVHVAAISNELGMACATSTSGHAFKMAGRVGDSPIIGAGLYVDNEVGTCGSIGHGEANLENSTSFAAVELMRGGMSPQSAAEEVLRRVVNRSHPSELDDDGRPTFNLQVFVTNKLGECAGASIWGGKQFAVCDEQGNRLEPCIPLFTR